MQASITIQPLEQQDLALIPAFQPKGWSDVAGRIAAHLGQPYFHPIKAVKNSKMVGIGQLILFETSAWLGNIIVRKKHRNQGIGKLITLHLMELANAFGREALFLLATKQGKPLYEKVGFQSAGTHLFYRTEAAFLQSPPIPPAIRRSVPSDYEAILQLDTIATGEDRQALLYRFLPSAWVFQQDTQAAIDGFYVPNLGEGLIIATNATAGIALLHRRNQPYTVFPPENKILCEHLETAGYRCFRTATMMYVGNNKNWNPHLIYSRIGGYAG